MIIEETTEHNDLIEFYISQGLDFGEDKKYQDQPVFSFIVLDKNKKIGACTYSKNGDDYILHYIATAANQQNNGIGSSLLRFTIEYIKNLDGRKIFLVAKSPCFFNKHGFKIIERSEAPDFSCCFACKQYQVNCCPEVMVLEINKA